MYLGLGVRLGGGARNRVLLARPFLTIPSANVGQTARINPGAVVDGVAGTDQYEWYADGVQIVGQTAATYTITSGEQNKTVTGRWRIQRASGNYSGWYPTVNGFVIAGGVNFLNDDQWTVREALAGVDSGVTTGGRQRTEVLATDPAASGTWGVYRGTAAPGVSPTAGDFGILTNNGSGNWTRTSGGANTTGALVYNRMIYRASDGVTYSWASNTKTYTVSTVPVAWDDPLLGGSVLVAAGTATGDLDVTINAFPNDGGQALTLFETQVDGGAWVSRTIATGKITFNFVEADPLNPVSHNIALRLTNVWGQGAVYTVAGVPKADVPTSTAAVISNLVFDDVNDKITVDVDQPGDFYLVVETNTTDRSTAYIQANLTSFPAYLGPYTVPAGETVIPASAWTGFTTLTTNTYYLKPGFENATGDLSAAYTVDVPMAVTGVTPEPTVVYETGIAYPSFGANVSFTLPSGANAPTTGNLIVIEFGCSQGIAQLGPAPTGWTTNYLEGDGTNGAIVLTWKVSDGTEGGTTITWSGGVGKLAAGVYREWTSASLVEGASIATGADAPNIAPGTGNLKRAWVAGASFTRSDGTMTMPSGFTSSLYIGSNTPGANNTGHVKYGSAYQLTTATSLDPATWTASTGTARGSLSYAVR